MKTFMTPLCVAGLLITNAGLAQAHVSLETATATAGSSYKAVLKIPHGCEGAATTKVSVTIPEGFISAQPQLKAGWQIETVKGDYAHSYPLHGKDITKGVTQITWQGGQLPDDFYDEFVVVGKLAAFDTTTVLSFPTIQSCDNGKSENWTEIAAEGQDPHSLKNPAPQLVVEAKASTGHDHHGASGDHSHHDATEAKAVTAGSLSLEQAYSIATIPNAPVAGGYITLTNHGKEDDRLLGASTDRAKKVEIHEMSMEGNVMKMRKLSEPLVIGAGKSVALTPSGFHIMFMGLEQPFKAGETVDVTLEFEKAGKVNLPFHVNPANGEADHSHGHSHH